MEGRVYLCGWEHSGESYKLWVRSNPRIQGKGATLNAAHEALWESIIRKYGDGEPVFEFQPPLPGTVNADDQQRPQFVSLFCTDSYRGYLADGRGPLFDEGTCEICGLPQGQRSDEPLRLERFPSAVHGIRIFIANSASSTMCCGVSRQAFSEEFLEMLTSAERDVFKWREVIPFRRAKRAYYEMLPRLVAPEVAKAGVSYWTWECPRCHRTPEYEASVNFARWPTYVSETDVAEKGRAFAKGPEYEPELCLPTERWDEMVASRKFKGLSSSRVVVLEKGEVGAPEKFPIPLYVKLTEIKDELWKQYRDDLLRSPEVRRMQLNPKISENDVWDYIHTKIDQKLALPYIYRSHFNAGV